MNRDLMLALAVALLSLLGLIALVGLKVYQAARPLWVGAYGDADDDDDYGSELVDLGGNISVSASASNWRPL